MVGRSPDAYAPRRPGPAPVTRCGLAPDVVKIPDRTEYRLKWGQLDSTARRRIVRSVNKGQALDNPREAALAVVTARRQQWFWKRAWLLGPVAGLLTIGQGFGVYLANAFLSTAIIGLMGYFWYRRAERAAAINLEAAAGRGKRKPKKKPKPAAGNGSPPRSGGGKGHLPGRRG